MKNRKGFTLIEIMIVVAIIGILALVLVPKIGGMKSQAKLAGMDTNMRVAEAVVQKVINDYTATQLDGLETTLQDRLPNDATNPFTDATGAGTLAAVNPAAPGVPASKAFAVDTTNTTEPAADAYAAENTALKGVIITGAYANGTQVKVFLIACDDKGKEFKRKTIDK